MQFIKKYVAVACIGLLMACDSESVQAPKPEVAVVKTAQVVAAEPSVHNGYPGRVQARKVAEVRARVAGIVLSRGFEEGAQVREGDRLFQIDPAPYQASLEKAQAERARTQAVLDEAQASFKRYARLVESQAVSRQDFDRVKGSFHSAQAAHQAAVAELKNAQLNRDYTTVKAPISGHVGRALVTEGALVGEEGPTQLALIQNIDSVYVDFKVPADELFMLKEKHPSLKGVPVEAIIGNGTKPVSGHLAFSDISVDPATDQILLRAVFKNAQKLLLPGMYVRARWVFPETQALVKVPQRAVKMAADGNHQVWLLDEGKVLVRTVLAGAMQGSDWLIRDGLREGEVVVVDGKVNPGDSARALQP